MFDLLFGLKRLTNCKRTAAAIAVVLAATPGFAGHECFDCIRKPDPSGPNNNCYGYYHTTWKPWPADCQPCVSSFPVTTYAPVNTPKPEKLSAPNTPPAVPPAVPSTAGSIQPANWKIIRAPENRVKMVETSQQTPGIKSPIVYDGSQPKR